MASITKGGGGEVDLETGLPPYLSATSSINLPAPSAPPAEAFQHRSLPQAVAIDSGTDECFVALEPIDPVITSAAINKEVDRLIHKDGRMTVKVTRTSLKPNGGREILIEVYAVPSEHADQTEKMLDAGDDKMSGEFLVRKVQRFLSAGNSSITSSPELMPFNSQESPCPDSPDDTVSSRNQSTNHTILVSDEARKTRRYVLAGAGFLGFLCFCLMIASFSRPHGSRQPLPSSPALGQPISHTPPTTRSGLSAEPQVEASGYREPPERLPKQTLANDDIAVVLPNVDESSNPLQDANSTVAVRFPQAPTPSPSVRRAQFVNLRGPGGVLRQEEEGRGPSRMFEKRERPDELNTRRQMSRGTSYSRRTSAAGGGMGKK
mmetsp:Transcript_14269/g.31259  ORF Transcript_14269/g.31259 Transcript_14269/m.31259 type:complete len:377 (-) Transcript_14269:52-1182(-)